MITFSEIFQRAVNLFDDPDINFAYNNDEVAFQKMMRPYLIGGIGLFTNPINVSNAISNSYTEAQGKKEVIDGEGTATYTLSTTPVTNAVFSFRINGKIDRGASYDAENNSVTFSRSIESTEKCSVEWYYAGQFNVDFSKLGFDSRVPQSAVQEKVKFILSYAVCVAVSEREKNFILDIKNTLTDTDFKLHSPAQNTMAKIQWFKTNESKLYVEMNQLAWMVADTQTFGASTGRGWR